MMRALRSTIAVIGLGAALSVGALAAAALALGPQSTTRVVPPSPTASASPHASAISADAFDCAYLERDRPTLPEDAPHIDRRVLDRSMRHLHQPVWKPP